MFASVTSCVSTKNKLVPGSDIVKVSNYKLVIASLQRSLADLFFFLLLLFFFVVFFFKFGQNVPLNDRLYKYCKTNPVHGQTCCVNLKSKN